MKNILVTGCAGFIGANFIMYMLNHCKDISVVNVDLLTYAGNIENLEKVNTDPRYCFVHGDICDPQLVSTVFRESNIDTVAHFAAESHVDRSILNPGLFVRTNVVGTQNLLEHARCFWGEKQNKRIRFHHVSTDEVFGTLNPQDPPFSEITPYDPRSPYSASKAASDHLVRAYFPTFGLPATISTCTNNYAHRGEN